MDEFERFQRFTRHLRIAHHIPGRIRLKLEADLDDKQLDAIGDARRFGKVLEDVPGIRSVKVNLLARSCTLEYDAKVIPSAAWSDFLEGVRSPASETLFGIVVEKYRELGSA